MPYLSWHLPVENILSVRKPVLPRLLLFCLLVVSLTAASTGGATASQLQIGRSGDPISKVTPHLCGPTRHVLHNG